VRELILVLVIIGIFRGEAKTWHDYDSSQISPYRNFSLTYLTAAEDKFFPPY
jgi:hypothetical protein